MCLTLYLDWHLAFVWGHQTFALIRKAWDDMGDLPQPFMDEREMG